MSVVKLFSLFVESVSGGRFLELDSNTKDGEVYVRWTVFGADGKFPLGLLPELTIYPDDTLGWNVGDEWRRFSLRDLWSVCPSVLDVDRLHPGILRLAADLRRAKSQGELDGRALVVALSRELGLHVSAAAIISMLVDTRWRFDYLRRLARGSWRFEVGHGSLRQDPPYKKDAVEDTLLVLELVSAEAAVAAWQSGTDSRIWMQPAIFPADSSGYWEFVDWN